MNASSAPSAGARDLAGVLVAITAIVIYALSCRPAWDPAGKQLAFPSRDGERSGIALYETGAQRVRRVVEESGGALAGAQCVWSANGRWLYVLRTVDKQTLRLLRVDPAAGGVEELVDVKGLDDADTIYPPTLADDRWLWVSAGKREQKPQHGAFRIDLAGRRAEHFFADDEKDLYVLDGGPRGLFYLRGPDAGPTEFGRLDPKAPRLARLLTLRKDDTSSFPAVEPSGRRVAWFDKAAAGPRLRLTDERGKALDSIPLPVDVEDPTFALWTGRGVVAAAERRPKDGPAEVGLLYVDMESKAARFVVLGSEANREGQSRTLLQPSASPDGRRIAVATSDLGLADGSTAALLIFAAADLDLPPERVVLPPSAERR
jgi:Tol biopolymer transport system component